MGTLCYGSPPWIERVENDNLPPNEEKGHRSPTARAGVKRTVTQ